MTEKIRLYGDEVLRKTAVSVPEITEKIKNIIRNMIDTLESSDEFALAAPQIGYSFRIFVIRPIWIENPKKCIPMVFINPEILEMDGVQNDLEGCLSVPNIFERVKRAETVRVRAQNVDGKWKEYTAHELFARAVQHENDHLDGTLFIDKISSFRKRLLAGKLKKIASTVHNGVNVG